FASGDVQDIDRRVDDADIRLMRNVKVDVVGAKLTRREHVLDGVAEDGDGPAENGPAVHVHVVQPFGEQVGRRRQAAAAGGPAEQIPAGAIGAHAVTEEALVRSAAG